MEESKQCTQCKRTHLLEQFRMHKQTGQVTKQCIKCLDIAKKSIEKNKCQHGKRKNLCKDCGGSEICQHQKIKSYCKDCGGAQICEHNRVRSSCKDCGGGSICEHQRIRSTCKNCGGGSICSHDKVRSKCLECGGGSICSHDKVRSICKECKGGSICQHDKERRRCEECDPTGHLGSIVRNRTYQALKQNKDLHSTEYLGCTTEELKKHIESQFKEGMSWKNYGEWHIDHKIPLKYKQDGISPTLEEVAKRLHYNNTQPLWASDNISKGNRYIS